MTNTLSILLFAAFVWQEVVPFKPSNEFEVMIDYKFRERPALDRTKEYQFNTDEKSRKSALLPYLKLQLKFLKLNADEVKVKIVNSHGKMVYSRKASEGAVIIIDVGYTDDVKDGVAPHEFTALLYSEAKKTTSRIHFNIAEDGTFMINDEKKGKF